MHGSNRTSLNTVIVVKVVHAWQIRLSSLREN